MNSTTDKVAVLIPYFQREPGILENTVRAVLSQKGFDNFEIVVVDDGSPVSAEDELAGITNGREKVTVIRQTNAGPGAARNTALDNVPPGTCYVALLDSDDEVAENYLADAVHALSLGYDMFFGNSKRADIEETRFDWDSGPGDTLQLSEHKLVCEERALYEFTGDFFDFIVYRSNIIGPSTMVFRHELGANVRYNEHVYNGQDRIYKLSLCQNIKRVVFSPRVYAQEGKGINIFDSAGWGSKRSLALLSSYIDMCKVILREIPLNPTQRAHVKWHLDRTRYLFTASLLHQLRHRAPVNWQALRHTLLTDPGTLIRFVPNGFKVAMNKTKPS